MSHNDPSNASQNTSSAALDPSSPRVIKSARSRKSGAVARRLLASFLAVMVAFFVTMGWAVIAQRRTAQDSELLRSGYLPLVLSVEAALENQTLVSAQLNHITEAKNPADARQWIETARRLRPRIYEHIRSSANMSGLTSSDAQVKHLRTQVVQSTQELETFLAQDGELLSRLFDALEVGDSIRARSIRDEVLAHEIAGARRVRVLKESVEIQMDELLQSARKREGWAMHTLLALTALTLLVGVGMTVYARQVLIPLAAVTARARAVAAGDMRPRPVVKARDEIGELAVTFESMVEAIAKANDARLQTERLAAVGRMAAHVTHEIRNPLSSIGLNLELLDEELAVTKVSAETRQLLQAIRREVDHLSALSEEYLRLARQRKPTLHAEGLGDMMREVAGFVRLELEKSSISLQMNVPDELVDVLIDEQQIRQVLLNLVRNACEAMSKGGTLTLRAVEVGEWVELTVSDTGVGIAEELRGNIFDPFFTTKDKGTGLGLPITRQIIQSHGGSIVCEPVYPHGTCFRIRLRRAEEAT